MTSDPLIFGKYKYWGARDANSKYQYFYDSSNLSTNIIKYAVGEGGGYIWVLKGVKEFDIANIHEKFVESFGDYVETGAQRGFMSEKMIRRIKSFGYLSNVYLSTKNGKTERFHYVGNNVTLDDRNENVIYIRNSRNFYSDFPMDKETGEIMNFTKFASLNRKGFNDGLKKFAKLVGADKVDVSKKIKNEADKRAIEEVDENGFRSLTERKDEYIKTHGFIKRLLNQ